MKIFKILKIFIFIMIIFLNFNVFALEKNVASYIQYDTDSATGTYKGDEIYLGGYNGRFSVGTRYNGRLSLIEFYLDTDRFDFTTNHTYTITLNMATDDWRNHFMGPQVIKANSNGTLQSSGSLSVSNFRFVSYKQIKFNFKTNGSLSPYLFFRLYSTDYASTNQTAITGTNNWKLSSIYISDNSSSSSSGGSTPTPTPSTNPNYSDITNNQNQNTDKIIDNQNQNTDDMINNANANTDKIIDNQQELLGQCIENLMTAEDVISLDNLYQSGNNFQQITADTNPNISLALQAYNNGTYQYNIDSNITISSTGTYGFRFTKAASYNQLKFKINGYERDTGLLINVSSLLDDHTYYIYADFFRITQGDIRFNHLIIKETSTGGFVPWGEKYCQSKLDSTNDAINNVNDTMKDDNIDDKTGFFTNFEDNSHGLTGIITLPLSTIQSLTNSSCVSLSIPIPFTNSNVSLPCMTQVYQTYIPSVYSIWQVVSFGIISYFICLDIFKIVKGFKDPNEDKIEVLDL